MRHYIACSFLLLLWISETVSWQVGSRLVVNRKRISLQRTYEPLRQEVALNTVRKDVNSLWDIWRNPANRHKEDIIVPDVKIWPGLTNESTQMNTLMGAEQSMTDSNGNHSHNFSWKNIAMVVQRVVFPNHTIAKGGKEQEMILAEPELDILTEDVCADSVYANQNISFIIRNNFLSSDAIRNSSDGTECGPSINFTAGVHTTRNVLAACNKYISQAAFAVNKLFPPSSNTTQLASTDSVLNISSLDVSSNDSATLASAEVDDRMHVQQIGNSFITLLTAVQDLVTGTGKSFIAMLPRVHKNTTELRVSDRSENQFSRVRSAAGSETNEVANLLPASKTSQVQTQTTTISTFLGKLYRRGRLLLGRPDPPTEHLSEAVLAYLAAADSLGLDLKEVMASTEEEYCDSNAGKFNLWSMIRNPWRKAPAAKTQLTNPPQPHARLNSLNSVEHSGNDLVEDSPVLKPSRADFAFVHARRSEMAMVAAMSVHSEAGARSFSKHVGIKPLISALDLERTVKGKVKVKMPSLSSVDHRAEAVAALSNLIRFDNPLAVVIASMPEVVSVLCDMMEEPTKRFRFWQSDKDVARNRKHQHEATELLWRMVRSSGPAGDILRQNERLRKVLSQIAEFDAPQVGSVSSEWVVDAVKELILAEKTKPGTKQAKVPPVRNLYNGTVTGELNGLQTAQMARIAAWGLGGVGWRPRVPGQKGLRILSLDGGGTRGVLSIAYLREIMKRVDSKLEPHQMFDIICGTSTGGIIATLLGAQRASLADAEVLYDAFIDKIFGTRSNMRLVTSQAAYDERDWEKILHEMCGDQLLLDSNQQNCPRVFCVSSKANTNTPTPNLWRNYNYPPGQVARYPGACRVNTFTAIRSTTAAPTFFTPVNWEGGLYYDGALVANNPTAIALQEAKLLYPTVPVELVVSIGTGLTSSHSAMRSMGWDVLVNQLIASSTDTEDVHALLHNFLAPDKYFRFNPVLPDALRIDEKNKTILAGLKYLAKKHIEDMERGPESKSFGQLIKTLRNFK